jgi:hypothetical protein
VNVPYSSDQETARDALRIVDPGACNPSGVIHVMADLCAFALRNGTGTGWLKRYPPLVLVHSQLVWLLEGRCIDDDRYDEALAWCRKAVREEEQVQQTVEGR